MSNQSNFFQDRMQAAEPEDISDPLRRPEKVWEDCNLLTFDGGGIRGYWSLLVMRQLMDHVSAIEMEDRVLHSFDPLPYPQGVSQIPKSRVEDRYERVYMNNTRLEALDPAGQAEAQIEALDPARRYLPCHYFDYIGGTSTGALIAIMLGRFRMTVLDCLYEYSKLGGNVFRASGLIRKALTLLPSGTKHRTADAVTAFKDVTKRRGEIVGGDPISGSLKLPSEKWMCQTFVTTMLTRHGGFTADQFVLRSYEFPTGIGNGDRQMPLSEVHVTLRKRTTYAENLSARDEARRTIVEPREYEKPHNLAIYRAARDATAATKAFEPERIPNAQGEEMTFEDGGLLVSNPTMVGIKQVRRKHGEQRFGVVVSVSTAKADHVQEKAVGKETLHGTAKRLTSIVTQTEQPHLDAREFCEERGIPYYRFNPEDSRFRVQTLMDEWEPRTATNGYEPGTQTLTHLQKRFEAWYHSDPAIAQMFRTCATELVERRRRRSTDQAKWERYITGCHYRCQEYHCVAKDRKFTFKDQFLEHCRDRPNDHPQARELNDEDLLKYRKHEPWKYQDRTIRTNWTLT